LLLYLFCCSFSAVESDKALILDLCRNKFTKKVITFFIQENLSLETFKRAPVTNNIRILSARTVETIMENEKNCYAKYPTIGMKKHCLSFCRGKFSQIFLIFSRKKHENFPYGSH